MQEIILDSGTTWVYLPYQEYELAMKYFNDWCSKDTTRCQHLSNKFDENSCVIFNSENDSTADAVLNTFPPLHFKLDGKNQ
jgi:hypothetical protein